jgi:hypothetical protein
LSTLPSFRSCCCARLCPTLEEVLLMTDTAATFPHLVHPQWLNANLFRPIRNIDPTPRPPTIHGVRLVPAFHSHWRSPTFRCSTKASRYLLPGPVSLLRVLLPSITSKEYVPTVLGNARNTSSFPHPSLPRAKRLQSRPPILQLLILLRAFKTFTSPTRA